MPSACRAPCTPLDAESLVHAVAQLPFDYIVTRPVHHCGEVDVTVDGRDVGDVRAPDLITGLNHQVPQQVGILPVTCVRRAQARLGVDRFDSHYPPQATHMLTTYLVIEFEQLPWSGLPEPIHCETSVRNRTRPRPGLGEENKPP